MAMYLLLPSVTNSTRDWSWVTSITLLPTGRPTALSVAWTLIHEIVFYLLFSLSYFTSKRVILLAGWAALILLHEYFNFLDRMVWPSAAISLLKVVLAPINFEFMAGMLASVTVGKAPPRSAPAFLIVGLSGVVIYFYSGELHRVWFGFSVALLLTGAVFLERLGGLRTPAWLLALGNASYAVYLVHDPIISALVRMIARFEAFESYAWAASMVICSLTAISFGFFYYAVYERPMSKILTGTSLFLVRRHRMHT
jgi:peptidoglycan/LPS O-acetylase OafA/YrhL